MKTENERGAALVAVVALTAITAVIGVAISAAVLSGTASSTRTRSNVQARAAADAGIDSLYAKIAAGNYICSGSSTTVPVFTATVQYRDAGGSTLSCAGSTLTTGTPAAATITSTGTAANKSTQIGYSNTKVIKADLAVTAPVTGGSLNNVLFSESGFTLSTNTDFEGSTDNANDANTYSNGTIICKTKSDVEGTLYSEGNISLQGSCETAGSAWAGGTVTFSSQAISGGDVWAAGTGLLDVSTGHVAGSIIANGNITIGSNGANTAVCPGTSSVLNVCGTVASLGGTVTTTNGAKIGGSIYAKSGIAVGGYGNTDYAAGADVLSITGNFTNGAANGDGHVGGSVRVGGTIGGKKSDIANVAGSCQGTANANYVACGSTLTIPAPRPAIALPAALGYPNTTVVNKPPRQQMPRINSATSDLNTWGSSGWTVTTYTASTASAAGYATSCAQALNWLSTSHSGNNLIVIQGCSSPLTFNSASITIGGNVAIMNSGGFTTNSTFTLKSTGSTEYGFEFIVPADSSNVTWTPVAGTSPTQYSPTCSGTSGNISIQNTTITNVAWFIYTPCSINFQNVLNGFQGQIYGGSVNYPNDSTIKLVKFTIPGIGSDGTASGTVLASATINSRYDVAG
ncbi:MAG: hypothetical protein EPN91_09060 [Salinibacterium sp.]|nr:MAG: hypothetical protein EPN91_09060 [Salinibacterium sp.]